MEELFIQLTCHCTHKFSFTAHDTSAGQTRRRKRVCFTSHATKILEIWYSNNKDYPYPMEDEIKQMAEDAKIETFQVAKWFYNKRTRTKNTKTTNGAMDPRTKRKKMLDKEAKENPAAAARGAAERKSGQYFLNKETVKALQQWYSDNKENPYPTPEEKKRLALDNDIKVSQVTIWFANSRMRKRKTNTLGYAKTETDLIKSKDIKQEQDDEQNPEREQEILDDDQSSENESNPNDSLKQEDRVY